MNDVLVAVLVACVWGAFAAILINRREAFERPYLWASLFAHQIAAAMMVVLTTYYYGGGDMTNYYAVGKFLAGRLRSDFLDVAPALINVILQREGMLPLPGMMMGSNTGSVQALSGFLVYLFQDSLYGVCMGIAGASFAAKVVIYDIIKKELPDTPRGPLAVVCLLFPSTVYWSAGLLKEPLAIVGLSLMLSGGYKLATQQKYVQGSWRLALGMLITGLFKGYLVPVFGIAAGMWFLARTVQRRLGAVVVKTRFVVAAIALMAATFVLTGLALPQFAPEVFAEEAKTAQAAGAHVEGGSNYELGSSGSISSQLPLAVATVFFRPMLIEATNPLIFLNSLEMLWITYMVIAALFRRPLVTTVRFVLGSPMLAFCVGFVATLSVGVGLTTTNLGTLSRYRMPLMPFYCVLLVALTARKELLVGSALPPATSATNGAGA